jgi:pimeloyl-ACP methyl ester carboxylesterase
MVGPAEAVAAPAILTRDHGVTIAYHATPAAPGVELPGVVFLTGFVSDMTGSKALVLERFCRARGQAFVRFDYRGHGASSGRFRDGTIGAWADDAVAVVDQLTEGPQILVGSSMGGWIMLLAALARPQRIHGLVGIAAAPDFTEDLMWDRFTPEIRRRLEDKGFHYLASEYDPQPYIVTRRLIEEARGHLLLRDTVPLACPVRLLHGLDDPDVPWQTSLRLAERLAGADVTVTLIKAAGHRLSEPDNIARIEAAVADLGAHRG